MDKTKLLSIGTLSKFTGVHIKSLRYYDEIGILPPAYVDPNTGYRYYSFSQIRVVDAIQLCVELDIPLKQFPEFTGSQYQQIYYTRLLAKGTQLAREKIRSIQERLDFLQAMEQEVLRGRGLQKETDTRISLFPQKLCLTIPMKGPHSTPQYYKGLHQIFTLMEQKGLSPGYEWGLLLLCQKEERRQYIFLSVEADGRRDDAAWDSQGLLAFPSAQYRFLRTEEPDIAQSTGFFSRTSLRRNTTKWSWKWSPFPTSAVLPSRFLRCVVPFLMKRLFPSGYKRSQFL